MKFLSSLTWQTKVVALLALVAVSFAAGWRVHGWKTDAGLARTIAKAEKTRQSDEKEQGAIVNDKEKKQDEVKVIYEAIREKVYVQDDQSVCFTAESLQLWNAAIGANRDLYRRESPGEAKTAQTSETEQEEIDGSAEESEQDPIATVQDVLINATDNIEICTDNSVKHLALIDRVRSLQGKMCYCSK